MDKQKACVVVDHVKCAPCSGLICVGVCPEGILEQGANKKPKVSDEASCTLCGVCVDLCPTKAISIRRAETGKEKPKR
jgi:NAD-dependent dihydropyrimidine dehydrogenase PreA subunit